MSNHDPTDQPPVDLFGRPTEGSSASTTPMRLSEDVVGPDGASADRGDKFIREVRLKNYKSIATCHLFPGRLNIFVGRNGSGKSNFLDAIKSPCFKIPMLENC